MTFDFANVWLLTADALLGRLAGSHSSNPTVYIFGTSVIALICQVHLYTEKSMRPIHQVIEREKNQQPF